MSWRMVCLSDSLIEELAPGAIAAAEASASRYSDPGDRERFVAGHIGAAIVVDAVGELDVLAELSAE